MPDLPPQADALYELPLAKFTEARNALAADLKRAGEAELGREVKKLRKPSLVAWALNQVARRHPEELAELVAVGDGLIQASESGDAGALRKLTARRHALVRELTQLAGTALSEDGRADKGPVLAKVSGSLYASATDMEGRDLLRRGRLAEELSGSGFDEMFALAVAGDASGTAIAEEDAVEDETVRRHEVLEREARVAEESLQRFRLEVERAEENAAGARRDAQLADAALEAARRAERTARRAAEEARRAAEAAAN